MVSFTLKYGFEFNCAILKCIYFEIMIDFIPVNEPYLEYVVTCYSGRSINII